MLLVATSEAVMCLSFHLMQLTLSSHCLLLYSTLRFTPQHLGVMASVSAFLPNPRALRVKNAFSMS